MQLWTERYKPEKTADILSQHKPLTTVTAWLGSWKKGTALLLHGAPGCGKTLMAELIAKERDFQLAELSASDERSKALIESFMNAICVRPLFHKGRIVLVDEVDGLSGHERGAGAALIALIKVAPFPVILTANDPWAPKLRSIRKYCTLVKFSKVHSLSVEKRLKYICAQEGISADTGVLKSLARWSQGDMRSALNDLQIVTQGKQELTQKDLEILGYREREVPVFTTLASLFNSGQLAASRKAFGDSDKDPDELLWWVDMNVEREFQSPDELVAAYDIVACADVFRALVRKQQNWRFKRFMIDVLAGISLAKAERTHRFVQYQPPGRLMLLGRTKGRRVQADELAAVLGEQLHASRRVVKREYFPLLKVLIKKKKLPQGFLEKEDMDFIKKY